MSDDRDCGHVIPRPTGGSRLTRFATRGEQRLSYESSGPGDGLPVLALHDLLAERGQLRALGETSGGHAMRLTLPDARGHGASPMISGRAFPTDHLVADALAVLEAEGLAETHVVAIGWGASTALGLAVTAPERVASLVLAAPYTPGLDADSDDSEPRSERARHREMLHEAATAAEKGSTDRALDLVFGARLGENWRDRLPKTRLGAIRRAAGNLAPLLVGVAAEPFGRAALERVDAPVTILLGENASVYDRGTAELLASLVPHARIEQVHVDDGDSVQAGDGAGWIPAIARALIARAA